MENAVEALRFYIRNPKEITVPAPPGDEPEKHEAVKIGPLEITLTLADLALHTKHLELARSLFLRAAKENPESPAAIAGLGSLALAEDRREDARRELERAIAMGYRDAAAYFELAALKNDNALLEKAVSIDPNFAEARFLLGVRATDSGNFPAALEHLHRAVTIKPRKFTYWHALGYAQAKAGDRQGAAESARRAAILASTGAEEQMADALTLLAGQQAPAVREKRPEVITPPSWQNRKGDARVEGTLTKVDCDSDPVRLTIEQTGEQPGKSIDLRVENPAAVELLNAEGASTTLVCGKQSRPVAVEYVGASKEITRIEFKQAIIKR
jgi:tetratricopeptide (TPR) repeat protein